MKLANRLDARLLAATGAAVATVGVANTANAAIVYSGLVNINIPSTTAGIYLNVVSGAFGGSTTPGWDVNPWSSAALNMFSSATQGGVPGATGYVGTGLNYFNLAPNAPIGPASTYGSTGTLTISAGTPLNLNSDQNLVGFRFVNEANGNQIHYGWMRIRLAGTAGGQPRAIVEYAYESVAGRGIGAGVIPAPASMALLALGAVGLGARRRK